MKFKLSLLAILVCSTNAFASDTSGKYNWSGSYVGGQVGYGSGSTDLASAKEGHLGKFRPKGFLGGIYSGYNHQFNNNMVVGLDVDFNGANIKKKLRENGAWVDSAGNHGTTERSVTAKMNWNAAVRARAGYAVDRFLPYIAGGVSYGNYGFKGSSRDSDGDIANLDEKRTMVGYNIGAGVDYAMTDSLVMRVEYRYSDFGKIKEHGDSFDLKTHDVRLGLAYKF